MMAIVLTHGRPFDIEGYRWLIREAERATNEITDPELKHAAFIAVFQHMLNNKLRIIRRHH